MPNEQCDPHGKTLMKYIFRHLRIYTDVFIKCTGSFLGKCIKSTCNTQMLPVGQ